METDETVFVTIGDGYSKSLTFTEADNTKVVLQYKGGCADIYVSGDFTINDLGKKGVELIGHAQVDQIIVSDNTAKSSLTISAKGGDNLAEIGAISGSGEFGKLTGNAIDLVGGGIEFTDGYINSILLHDVLNGADILMTGEGAAKGTTLTLNEIGQDTDIVSGSGINSFKAVNWDSGSLEAPWVKTFAINGNAKTGAAGNLGAQVELTGAGADTLVLGKATVKGQCSGVVHVNGDAGSVSIQKLIGELNIEGNVKSVKLGDNLSLLPASVAGGAQAASGIINITGSGSIKGGSESMKISDGAELYTTTGGLYNLADLLMYNQAGASWDYLVKVTGHSAMLASGSATDHVYVSSAGTDQYRVSETVEVEVNEYGYSYSEYQEQSFVWLVNESGTYLTQFEGDMDLGYVSYYFDSLQAAQSPLGLKQTQTDTAPLSGYLTIEYGWYDFDVDMDGTAEISTTLLGHESVTVNGQTYLAAKVQMNLSYQMDGILDVYGQQFKLMMSQANAFTYWAVPDYGIVKTIEKGTANVKIPGAGSEKASLTIEKTLL
jgi:hypothetical protein